MTPKQSRGESLSARARAALLAGLGARAASKAMGRGAGGMFGGRVALRVNPEMIEDLSAGKRCVLITGTNGKSTTTKMVASALSAVGRVAGNLGGDNMQTGVATALMVGRDAHLAALEVDEMNMPDIAGRVSPEAIVLLNLSRDQLDRVGEIGTVEKRLRDAVNANPQATIIANCDDPLVVSAAWDAPKVVWVAAGAPWKDDAVSFPRTATLIERHGDDHALAGRQAICLDDDGCPLPIDVGVRGRDIGKGLESRRRNLVSRHEALGEILGTLELRGFLGRPEDLQAARAENVHYSRS